jgi:hypothetical protein
MLNGMVISTLVPLLFRYPVVSALVAALIIRVNGQTVAFWSLVIMIPLGFVRSRTMTIMFPVRTTQTRKPAKLSLLLLSASVISSFL